MSLYYDDGEQPSLDHLRVHPDSLVRQADTIYGLSEMLPGQRQLAVLAPHDSSLMQTFEGTAQAMAERTLLLGPLNAHNAAAIRRQIDWLNPTVLGLRTSAGFGDRLGVATPGHLQAVRAVGGHIAPIPAQQSIREMTRTGRSPQQVMDDAMWGVFATGWRDGFGADADHLKTPADIDRCLAAGFTFYTFDPGEHVDNEADTASPAILRERFDALPWDRLEDAPTALVARYADKTSDYEGYAISFDVEQVTRAAVKYGRAIAHIAMMYRYLASHAGDQPWEVEVSVDETETPTSHGEHVYFATELRRLGVRWVSLAPRFIGRFEKGVDYIGDLDAFADDIAVHAAIARALGPYKISLHSGSDKFSIYAIAAEATRGNVHLKTAGTSYLEALRTVGQIDPDLLLAIYAFAYPRYETDRASYHVSAQLDRAPSPESINAATISVLLDQFDAREILHVTFGSVLTYQTPEGTRPFAERIMAVLQQHPDAYAANLVTHFVRHLTPFAAQSHA
jgi:tagaturonate epimerase